jgi:hypothetical protein
MFPRNVREPLHGVIFQQIVIFIVAAVTNQLRGAESFMRSRQLFTYSKSSKHFANPNVHYRVHKSPTLVPIQSHIFLQDLAYY